MEIEGLYASGHLVTSDGLAVAEADRFARIGTGLDARLCAFRAGRGDRFLGRIHPPDFWTRPRGRHGGGGPVGSISRAAGDLAVAGGVSAGDGVCRRARRAWRTVAGVETGIALSAIALGAMVALAARPPLWVAAALVGAFAVFHGYAHGAELPIGADAISFSMGFVIATGMLHLAGIAFGALSHWPIGRIAVRAAGGVIALIGFGFLTGVI